MDNSKKPTKRLLSDSCPSSFRETDFFQVPRGTPQTWLIRWQLASRLRDRLEMIHHD